MPLLLTGALLLSSFKKAPLSEEVRSELEPFFRMIFSKSEFAYTLFGDKPISFYSYFDKQPAEIFLYAKPLEPRLEQHFKLYRKYEHLFNTQNFLLLDQPCISDKFSTSGFSRDILIINKRALIEIVDKHKDIFTARLSAPITGKTLLAEIEAKKNVLYEVLREDELLWGILLGYGTHNAQLYACRGALLKDDPLTGFSHEYYIDLIPLPLFFCDKNHIETVQLKEKYREIQKKISAIYFSQDFFSIVANAFFNRSRALPN